MAERVSWETLRRLASFRAQRGCAISLYLNLDPTIAATAGEVSTRINSLLAAGERSEAVTRQTLGHERALGHASAEDARVVPGPRRERANRAVARIERDDRTAVRGPAAGAARVVSVLQSDLQRLLRRLLQLQVDRQSERVAG